MVNQGLGGLQRPLQVTVQGIGLLQETLQQRGTSRDSDTQLENIVGFLKN